MYKKSYINFDFVLKAIEISGLDIKEFYEKIGISRQSHYKWRDRGGTSYENYQKIRSLLGDKTPHLDKQTGIVTKRVNAMSPKRNILHVPINVQAGVFAENPDPVTTQEMTPWSIPDLKFDAYSFDVVGESMLGTLSPGDKVIVSRESDTTLDTIKNDYIYVLDTLDGLFIKRILKQNNKTHIWLISDNTDFDDRQIEVSRIRGIYKVRRFLGWELSPKMKRDE